MRNFPRSYSRHQPVPVFRHESETGGQVDVQSPPLFGASRPNPPYGWYRPVPVFRHESETGGQVDVQSPPLFGASRPHTPYEVGPRCPPGMYYNAWLGHCVQAGPTVPGREDIIAPTCPPGMVPYKNSCIPAAGPTPPKPPPVPQSCNEKCAFAKDFDTCKKNCESIKPKNGGGKKRWPTTPGRRRVYNPCTCERQNNPSHPGACTANDGPGCYTIGQTLYCSCGPTPSGGSKKTAFGALKGAVKGGVTPKQQGGSPKPATPLQICVKGCIKQQGKWWGDCAKYCSDKEAALAAGNILAPRLRAQQRRNRRLFAAMANPAYQPACPPGYWDPTTRQCLVESKGKGKGYITIDPYARPSTPYPWAPQPRQPPPPPPYRPDYWTGPAVPTPLRGGNPCKSDADCSGHGDLKYCWTNDGTCREIKPWPLDAQPQHSGPGGWAPQPRQPPPPPTYRPDYWTGPAVPTPLRGTVTPQARRYFR